MNDKQFQLELKKIDYKLEKERDLHTSMFSVLVGVLMFVVTTSTILNTFSTSIGQLIFKIFEFLVKFNQILAVAVLVLMPFLIGYLCSLLFALFFKAYMKTKADIYDKRLKDVTALMKRVKR